MSVSGNNQCNYSFKSGKKKGQVCGKNTNGLKCSRHTSTVNENPSSAVFLDTFDLLQYKLLALDTCAENRNVIIKKFRYLETLTSTSTEYQKNLNWLRHALNFPYSKMVRLPLSMKLTGDNKDVTSYVTSVYKKLDDHIYGMPDVKEELMSFVCKRISNPDSNDHILALQGNQGVGKTRLAHSLAVALDLPIKTINLGSVNDVSYFTGHGFTYVDSEPGRIVQILNETQAKNCIIYFDELDKIHQTDKGQAIYAFLTHLIDPSQNTKYQDVYLSGLELDVSKIFFVFSFNDESLLDVTVKDRLKIIKIKDPSFQDKVSIAEKFMIPEICRNVNYDFTFKKYIIEKIVSTDNSKCGCRNVKRILEDIISKFNVIRMLDDDHKAKMSFYRKSTDDMLENIITKHATDNSARPSMYS